jgi:hypothetical protein
VEVRGPEDGVDRSRSPRGRRPRARSLLPAPVGGQESPAIRTTSARPWRSANARVMRSRSEARAGNVSCPGNTDRLGHRAAMFHLRLERFHNGNAV